MYTFVYERHVSYFTLMHEIGFYFEKLAFHLVLFIFGFCGSFFRISAFLVPREVCGLNRLISIHSGSSSFEEMLVVLPKNVSGTYTLSGATSSIHVIAE